MATFEKTHPWISFQFDMRAVPFDVWLLAGEARSKCDHLAGVPMQPALQERLHQVYLAKGAHATTAIEGNTLSEEQVAQIVEGHLDVPVSKEYLKLEVQNVLAGIHEVFQDAMSGKPPFPLNTAAFERMNGLVLKGLTLPPEVLPGQLRRHDVGVTTYRAPSFKECAELLERLSRWLEELQAHAPPSMGLAMPIIRAVLAHLYMAWIHPFGDGNGRTARLLEFAILIRAGIPSPAAHLLSNHYNDTRADYYRQLQYASQSGGDIFPFLRYALQGFVDGLKSQIDEVRKQTLQIVWRDYVHDQFRDGEDSAVERRRKHLLLALSLRSKPTSLKGLRELDARVASEYARVTSRTLLRDLSALHAKKLIRITKAGYVANVARVEAFLPAKAKPLDQASAVGSTEEDVAPDFDGQLSLAGVTDDVPPSSRRIAKSSAIET